MKRRPKVGDLVVGFQGKNYGIIKEASCDLDICVKRKMKKGDLVFGICDFDSNYGKTVWIGLILRGPERRQDGWMVQICWERVSEKYGILRGYAYTAYEYDDLERSERRFVEEYPNLIWAGDFSRKKK